jgi:hypothetical protein
MTQPDLFLAATAKTKAIDLVEANADARWLDEALTAVRLVAARYATFTTDDLWLELAKAGAGKGPHERRAMGAVMRKAVHLKIARPLNAVKGSASTVNHGRPLRVWAAWS